MATRQVIYAPGYANENYLPGADTRRFWPVEENVMPSNIEIKNVVTGEIRLVDTLEDDDSTFIWEEGNYSCDCNRYLFFERAGGNDPDDDVPCGTERYLVRIPGRIDKFF